MDTRREMMGGVLSSSKLIDNYLTIEALEDGLFASFSFNACEYCIDSDGNGRSLPMDTRTETINTGQTLSFRGEIIPDLSSGIGSFSVNKKFNLLGNCMSMLFGDNAANNFSLEGKDGAFTSLFEASKVIEVSDTFLPATILSSCCYYQMFVDCDYLIKAPTLPATTLAKDCCLYMFSGCTSLTTAPELPAMTLAIGCYMAMFRGCSNLTTAPELLAPMLVDDCYQHMFGGCTKLNYIKMLATDMSVDGCLYGWVNGVASTGTFVKHPDMTNLPTGISGIPNGGVVANYEGPINIDNYLTIQAKESGLTASLSTNEYEYCIDGDGYGRALSAGATTEAVNAGQTLSFRGNLTPTSSNGVGTFSISKKCNLLGNCMSLLYGNDVENKPMLAYGFYKLFQYNTNIESVAENFLPATELAEHCYHFMFDTCSNLYSTPKLPAMSLQAYCYYGMFKDCANLTTAPELPATTLVGHCYRYMFNGCSKLVNAPELLAEKVLNYSYQYMFNGCSSLNYIKMLATDISANNCLTNWVNGVSSTGTFVKNQNATWNVTGVNGVPSGWTIQYE